MTYFFSSSIKNYGRYIKIYRYPNYRRKHPRICVSRIITAVISELVLNRKTYSHPSESYLIFEGRVTKADDTLYVNADEVALTNNAIMHLFSRTECHLSNQLIESLNYPGEATTMLDLLKYPDDFSKAQGLNQLWYEDTATTAVKADNNGFAIKACISHPVNNRQRYLFFYDFNEAHLWFL